MLGTASLPALAHLPAHSSHPPILTYTQSLLEAVIEFLAAERQAVRQGLQKSRAAAAAAELAPPAQQQAPSGSSSNWQKKGGGAAVAASAVAASTEAAAASAAAARVVPAGPWADALGAAALLSASGGSASLDATEAELAAATDLADVARGGPRQELVVVASLLTKAPNLAGLARTCEVFR